MSSPSSRQTSQEILYESLASSAKITRRIHGVIQKELAGMEAELSKPGTVPSRRMELLGCICEVGAELSRQTESIAKLITSRPMPTADTSGGGTQSISDIMSELVDGKKRHG